MYKKIIPTLSILVIATFLAVTPVSAQSNLTAPNRGQSPGSEPVQSNPQTPPEQGGASEPLRNGDSACRAIETTASSHMVRLADLNERHLSLFTTISERVDQFYRDNDLAVDGYDDQLADIEDLDARITDLVAELRSDSDEFECGDDNLGEHVRQFRQQLPQSRELLGDLRQAVRDQVVAVRTAVDATVDEETENDSQEAGLIEEDEDGTQ